MSDMPFSGSILSGCESGGKKEKKRKSGFTFEKSKNDNKATKHGGGGGEQLKQKYSLLTKQEQYVHRFRKGKPYTSD